MQAEGGQGSMQCTQFMIEAGHLCNANSTTVCLGAILSMPPKYSRGVKGLVNGPIQARTFAFVG